MSGSWRRRHARHLARAFGWTAGVTIIALAVLVALAQLLLPLLARHPQWVAAQLSERLQRPVHFASMEGRWQGSGPLFVLRDVSIGSPGGGAPLRLPQSEVKIDFGGWLLPSRHLLNLQVRGLQLDLGHDRAGRWHVNGIGVAGGERSGPVSLGPVSLGIRLIDLHVRIADEVTGKQYGLVADQFLLSRQHSEIRIGLLLRREGAAGRWRGAGRFRTDGSGGRLWLSGDRADLPALLGDVSLGGYVARGGHGNLSVWMDWKQGRIVRSTARFELTQLALANASGVTVDVPALRGLASLQREADGYTLRWAADDGGALVAALRRSTSGDSRIDVDARQVQVAPLLPWLALKPDLVPGLVRWFGSGKPAGVITHAALGWSEAAGLERAEVAFSGLRIDPVGQLPGTSGLAGVLRGDAQALTLQLPAQATVILAPHAFRQPFPLDRLAGTVAFWHAGDVLHIGADAIEFSAPEFAGQARGEVSLSPRAAPFLDVYARIDRAEVVAAKAFLPRSMSPVARDWLDHALVAGKVDHGSLILRGSLADWPFRHNEGRFEAHAALSDLTLDYGGAWPRATGLAVQASFVGNGMLAQASAGESLGVKVSHAVAVIPDFGDGLLDLNVQGEGSGGNLFDFVRHSPVGEHQAATLAKMHLGGKGTFDFHLAFPLHDASALQLTGTAQLSHADLVAPDWNLRLDGLTGPVAFDARGLRAGPLAAGFRGQPSTLELAIADATAEPDTLLWAHLAGRYRMDELTRDHPSLDWLAAAADGRGEFDIGFNIKHVVGTADDVSQQLTLDSSLRGMALDLPAPLDKAAASALPLHMTLPLPVGSSDLQIAVGDLLRGRLRLPADDAQSLAGTIELGEHMPATLPDKGLRIRGHARVLDATGWLQSAVAGGGGEGPGLDSIDVTADRARVFGNDFNALQIKAAPTAEALGIDVDGPGMLGHFSVPTRDLRKRGVTGRLQRLYWPKGQPAASAQALAKPGAVPARASSARPVATAVVGTATPAATGIDPATLPPLHLWVGDLRLGEARLGEARLETWPTAQGMHIDQLRALSRKVQITATGNWTGNAADSHTRLHIDFAAEDVGSLLGALGYEGLFDGGKTRAQLDATWPGAPSALALANMDGTLSINVVRGHIPEVAAGVGRLFGLVSLAELPRRLTLDFGDVFGKGLAFDAITGDFRLGDGSAVTDNLKIVGPAAEIRITGRTGLRAHDYDQQVWVMPHLGGSLPVVGAVVGGPVGAAAGFAVQGLLGKGLNKAASARYRITGSWDKPVMTLIEKHGAVAPKPPAKPGVGIRAPAAPGSAAVPAPAGSVQP